MRAGCNDAYRIVHNIPRFMSASESLVAAEIPTFRALIRRNVDGFVQRWLKSPNNWIKLFMNLNSFWLFKHYEYYNRTLSMWSGNKCCLHIYVSCLKFVFAYKFCFFLHLWTDVVWYKTNFYYLKRMTSNSTLLLRVNAQILSHLRHCLITTKWWSNVESCLKLVKCIW